MQQPDGLIDHDHGTPGNKQRTEKEEVGDNFQRKILLLAVIGDQYDRTGVDGIAKVGAGTKDKSKISGIRVKLVPAPAWYGTGVLPGNIRVTALQTGRAIGKGRHQVAFESGAGGGGGDPAGKGSHGKVIGCRGIRTTVF